MEHVDLFRYSEQFAEQFAAANTFAEFAASLDASKPGPGRLLQHIAEQYPDSWELSFRTIKAHGFVGRELLLREAKAVEDIFAAVSLYEYATGGMYRDQIPYVRDGFAFVSALRCEDFAYFGRLGAIYDWSPDWLKRGEKIRRVHGGTQYLTAAKPTQAVIDAYGPAGAGEWDLATFEVIKHETNLLVTVRANNGFGERWLAVLPLGSSALPMMGEHERGEIAAEQARQVEAWGARSGESTS
jgi:hypothetical protein